MLADWRALYDSWDNVSVEKKKLIKKLFKEKPKETLIDFFEREPYAKLIYEKLVGTWETALPEVQPPQNEHTITDDLFAFYNKLENTILTNAANKTIIALHALTLTTLFGAEIAYYNLQEITFLHNGLPFILLVLTAAFGLASVIYSLKLLKDNQKCDNITSLETNFHD